MGVESRVLDEREALRVRRRIVSGWSDGIENRRNSLVAIGILRDQESRGLHFAVLLADQHARSLVPVPFLSDPSAEVNCQPLRYTCYDLLHMVHASN